MAAAAAEREAEVVGQAAEQEVAPGAAEALERTAVAQAAEPAQGDS